MIRMVFVTFAWKGIEEIDNSTLISAIFFGPLRKLVLEAHLKQPISQLLNLISESPSMP
jgi:hypothetical protein